MRKFFAATLAAAMTLSMAATSFATVNTVADIDIAGPYRYDSDDNSMKSTINRYGEGTYYAIKIHDADSNADAANSGTLISSYKEVEKLKVKTEFEMGEDLVESVSVVKKYVDKDASDSAFTADGYFYFVEFKVASKQVTYDSDIIGTLEFNRKADKDVTSTSNGTTNTGIGKIDGVERDFEFNVFYKDTWLNNDLSQNLEVKGDVELKWDTNYALKFNYDDEVELQFGYSDLNEGTFTVDVSGQGKLFVRYNTKANDAIADANPGVKMHFINFNDVKFNRVGEFVYEMDDIAAAYKIVDNKLVEINGLELDSDSATFNTRTLESYVFADAELVNPTAKVEAPAVEAPVVAPVVTNPSTGANA